MNLTTIETWYVYPLSPGKWAYITELLTTDQNGRIFHTTTLN